MVSLPHRALGGFFLFFLGQLMRVNSGFTLDQET